MTLMVKYMLLYWNQRMIGMNCSESWTVKHKRSETMFNLLRKLLRKIEPALVVAGPIIILVGFFFFISITAGLIGANK